MIDLRRRQERHPRCRAAYLNYLYTPEAQDIIAQWHYRPRNIDVYQKYDQFLPAAEAVHRRSNLRRLAETNKAFFADGGVFDQIYKPTK